MDDSQIAFLNREGKIIPISDQTYPDGFPVINGNVDLLLGEPQLTFTQLLVRPLDASMLMKALWFADALRFRGHPIKNLILPYLPGARQDRMANEGDILFAAKSIANEINARQFDNVICFDPHSEVMPALIDNCRVVHVDEVEGLIDPGCYDGVVAPDAGAAKRAEAIAKTLKIPVFNAWKTRDIASGNSKITGFGIEDTSGVQRLLIVDDICDGGGTFSGLAGHIDAQHATSPPVLTLYVSHGLFTKGTQDLEKYFETIITTDSTSIRSQNYDSNIVKFKPVVKTLIDKGYSLA